MYCISYKISTFCGTSPPSPPLQSWLVIFGFIHIHPPVKMVNRLHLYSAFLGSGHSKRFTIWPHIHPFMHTFTLPRRCQPWQATGGAGDGTSNLPVTSQPALPPETHAALRGHLTSKPTGRTPTLGSQPGPWRGGGPPHRDLLVLRMKTRSSSVGSGLGVHGAQTTGDPRPCFSRSTGPLSKLFRALFLTVLSVGVSPCFRLCVCVRVP